MLGERKFFSRVTAKSSVRKRSSLTASPATTDSPGGKTQSSQRLNVHGKTDFSRLECSRADHCQGRKRETGRKIFRVCFRPRGELFSRISINNPFIVSRKRNRFFFVISGHLPRSHRVGDSTAAFFTSRQTPMLVSKTPHPSPAIRGHGPTPADVPVKRPCSRLSAPSSERKHAARHIQ